MRPEWSERLEQSFSRSFTTAHLRGPPRRRAQRRPRRPPRRARRPRERLSTRRRARSGSSSSKPVAEGDVVYLYTPWGQTEPRRLETGGDATITLRVRERVAVKDRLFRLAAADVGELAPRPGHRARARCGPIELAMRLSGAEGAPAALTGHRSRPAARAGHGRRRAEPLAAGADGRAHARRAHATRSARSAARPTGSPSSSSRSPDGLFLAVGDLKDLRRRAVAALGERRVAARRRAAGRAAPGPAGAAPAAHGSAPSRRRARAAAAPPGRPASASGRGAARRSRRGGAYCLDVLTGDAPEVVAARRERCARRARPCACACRRSCSTPTRPGWRTCSRCAWDAVVVRNAGLLARR